MFLRSNCDIRINDAVEFCAATAEIMSQGFELRISLQLAWYKSPLQFSNFCVIGVNIRRLIDTVWLLFLCLRWPGRHFSNVFLKSTDVVRGVLSGLSQLALWFKFLRWIHGSYFHAELFSVILHYAPDVQFRLWGQHKALWRTKTYARRLFSCCLLLVPLCFDESILRHIAMCALCRFTHLTRFSSCCEPFYRTDGFLVFFVLRHAWDSQVLTAQ